MNKYSYISSLNLNKINLYTLQLANMKRIEENDAVYIFDEVGAGKTISAGLCAIQLLFEHNDNTKFNNILVITAPSVVEQFACKLEDVLGLQVNTHGNYNNKEYTIDIINYDYRNIKNIKEQCKEYDFIIIDEAHEFLNEDTKRYKELINLNAKKILFLTATPIKYSKKDLECYPKIASKIIKTDYEKLSLQFFKSCNDKKSLSSGFNSSNPISRYFKETVRNIQKTENENEDYRNKEPQRLLPQLWKYNFDEDVNLYLANKIESLYNGKNKFVIFVMFRQDAEKIADALENLGFSNYTTEHNTNKKFCVITGDTKNRSQLLKRFSSANEIDTIPDVLILTYKISEQGIDLPAYNYIINYHISASPSQLEQRFGRIDRLNSVHDKLNSCFLIRNNNYDTNTNNFYTSISTYIDEFLPLLPSKNCLITPEILDDFNKNNDNILDYYSSLKENIYYSIGELYTIMKENYTFDEVIEKHQTFIKEWLFFIIDKCVEFNDDINLFKKNIIKKIDKCINQVQSSKEKIQWWKENIDAISNNLFYIDTNEEKIDWSKKYNLKNIDPKSAAQEIINLATYRNFSEEVKKPVERMRILNNVRQDIENDFEQAFHKNDFEFLFPYDGMYDEIYKKYFTSTNDLLSLEDINEYVTTLPFFKMCEKYKEIVQGYAYNDMGYLYEKYKFDPFYCSIYTIFLKSKKFNLNSNFFDNYIDNKYNLIGKPFYIKIEFDTIKSSNWLKLFYKYSRREEFSFAILKNIIKPIETVDRIICSNIFIEDDLNILPQIKTIHSLYLKTDCILRKIKQIQYTTETQELEKYNATLKKFEFVRSLFNYFLYTMENNMRKTNNWNNIYYITINSERLLKNCDHHIYDTFKKYNNYDNCLTKYLIRDLAEPKYLNIPLVYNEWF